ncbi:MAG: hypothetical protein JNL72_09140 [Flavipsychrobacter sp.]|nr:hypothetical protein [Flavipsychrobacter sp.]
MKRIVTICLLLAAYCTMQSCKKDKTTPNDPTNNAPADPKSYDQYITCKIDGTTYTAYYAPGHTTNIACMFNNSVQTVFETSADEITVTGGAKLLSNMSVTLFGFQAKGAGTYEGGDDLYLDGALERQVDGAKQRLSFVVVHGQTLTVSSYSNGYIEGTFAVQVYDENSNTDTYQVTEGSFRMKVN